MAVLKAIIILQCTEEIAVIKTNYHRRVDIKQKRIAITVVILMIIILNHKKVITFRKHSGVIMPNRKGVS